MTRVRQDRIPIVRLAGGEYGWIHASFSCVRRERARRARSQGEEPRGQP